MLPLIGRHDSEAMQAWPVTRELNRVGLPMKVTRGRLEYELAHLRAKLAVRDPVALQRIAGMEAPEPHPLFEVLAREVEEWEVLS